jgi:3-keto-5-aminohexanoate cleavage enzyme
MEENLVIDFTPTGMIPTKRFTPYVPITASEII